MGAACRLLGLAIAATLAASGSAAAAPMIVLFGPAEANRQIVRPSGKAPLPLDGRLFIQEPSIGHLFAGEADKPYRLSGLPADELVRAGSAQAMVNLLKGRIDATDCDFNGTVSGCRSHLVFVSEIDYRFAEPAPNLNTPRWAGKRAQFPTYVPVASPGQAGFELSAAMEALSSIPWRGGGTYAERVHFYVAPGVISSIGKSKGPYFNLGRDRRPHFRSHEGVRAALRLAGGVWLEMYHFSGRRFRPFNTYEWTWYPSRFAGYMTGPGQSVGAPDVVGDLHFLMTNGMPVRKSGAPAACRSRGSSQACQFALASLARNRAILANGPGRYQRSKDRSVGEARQWRAHVKRLFFS